MKSKLSLYVFALSLTTLLSSCSGGGDSKTSPSLNSEASLSTLNISSGTLTPSFSNTIDTYTLNLKNRFDQISFDITSDTNSTFSINGNNTLTNLPLDVGSNTFTISVTSQDGSSQKDITITISRARQFVFVSNVDTGNPADTLSLYSINPISGQLEAQTVASQSVGDDPYDLLVSPQGDFLYVANAGDNTISQFSINPTTGALTAMSPTTVATGATPYGLTISSDDQSFYVPMGGSATPGLIYQYGITPSTGNLTPLTPATINSGNNPWFMTISPDDRFVYSTIFNGFGDANPDTIEMFSRDQSTGNLTALTPSSIATGDKPWHINVHPNGQFLYNTNYGDATVSAYQINATTGQLTELAGSPFTVGNSPIGLSIDPQGRFLYVANSSGNTLSMFSINTSTGALSNIGGGTIASSSPYGLEVDHSGRFLYAVNTSNNTVSMFSINQTTGALSALGSPTISAGTGPRFIRIAH